MPYLRWLHKIWKYIWTFIGVLVLTVSIICVTGFGILQLQPVKDRIALELQDRFNKTYNGVLSIGSLEGLLPMQIELRDVKIYPDSSAHKPVIETSGVDVGINLWFVLRNQLHINSLEIVSPKAIFDAESTTSVQQAFKRRNIQTDPQVAKVDSLPNIEVLIPSVKVNQGKLVFRNVPSDVAQYLKNDADSVELQELNLEMFFEFTHEQRFVDIDEVGFLAPQLTTSPIKLYGQIYNDNQFLELNAINLSMGNSTLKFSGEAERVNILKENVRQQFMESSFELILSEFSLAPNEFTYIQEKFPEIKGNIKGSASANGTLDSLALNSAELIVGESFLTLNGHLKNLSAYSNLSYGGELETLMMSASELQQAGYEFNKSQAEALKTARVEGDFSGNLDSSMVNLHLISDRGDIFTNGTISWDDSRAFSFNFNTDSLDIGNIIIPEISSSNLTLQGEIRSSSLDLLNSNGGLTIELQEGVVEERSFDQFVALVNWRDGFFEPNIRARLNGSSLTTSGWIDLKSTVPEYNLQGSAKQIDINQIIRDERLNNIVADFEYDLNLKGSSLDDLYGQFSIDVPRAITETDTLSLHQLYVDFNEPDAEKRIIRFTSTAFDATAEGTFRTGNLQTLWPHWKQYFNQRIARELTFNTQAAPLDSTRLNIANQELEVTARIKNPDILRFYISDFPEVYSSARIQSSINISSNRLLFSGSIIDTETVYNQNRVDSLNMQITGSFRYGASLKEFAGLQVQASGKSFESGVVDGSDFSLAGELNQDSLTIRHAINGMNRDATFNFEGRGVISEESLTLSIPKFVIGSRSLLWENQGIPTLIYDNEEKLTLRDFVFQSGDQRVEIDGTFSSAIEDSVNYQVENAELANISDIIGGRISFDGIMDGKFTTRTLTTVPTIQGNIDVEEFSLNNQVAGDVNISSQFDSDLNRFNTHITIKTDSAKYPEYFANTDRKGQNFDIRGYVLGPKDGEFPEADSLYRFKADFSNIDLWILPLIGPKVFAESSGRANGKGTIWGNLDTYGFESEFMVGTESAAYLKPQFLETNYYAQGPITFTRERGFSFNDIYLVDPSGGSAILSGYYDLNDFGPVDSLDISLDMDEFQFLNSKFDPTVAFFGSAYGSSTVTISGTNFDPVLRTEEPMQIADFSEISIPLLEETEFNEDNRFIRFVETFENFDSTLIARRKFNKEELGSIPANQELTFAERFTLDLQFVASDPMTVRLIFDPVTGDIVTAEGTGRIRILLEDEEVSMFGRFDIEGGRYQFVSGDIFTRRFELESGGSIIWEGDPANARLDLNAIYSARPDINSLSSSNRDPENAQRVPIDLVLNIGGTITSIENDFYFRLPSTIETQQSSTLSTQIASINRDEDLKLIQAANFMLMGDFIPVSSAGGTQSNLFGDNISGSAAVLNPLISSQLINPLLSNQVNSLLNSDLSSLDVDFNLNTYNQVDLGVALRLYNDKLILRREGQITGRQSNIGDLGATYRINRTFAVMAFHRQDLTFGTLSSTEQSQQAQEINGVGVEAKVSFNSWNEFFNRLFSPFRKLFGIQNQEDEDEITENRGGNPPS